MSPGGGGLPFDLVILGMAEVARLAPDEFTHACSILDPDTPVPGPLRELDGGRRLDLRFHDVVDEVPGAEEPRTGHVADLLAFGRTLAAVACRPRLLVHCQLGLSRSTAAAALLVAHALPSTSAADVLAAVIRSRPDAWPNLRLVALGDTLLGRRARSRWRRGSSWTGRRAAVPCSPATWSATASGGTRFRTAP